MKTSKLLEKLGILMISSGIAAGCGNYYSTSNEDIIWVNGIYKVINTDSSQIMQKNPGFSGTEYIDYNKDGEIDVKYSWVVSRIGRGRVKEEITEEDKELFSRIIAKANNIRREHQ